MKNKNINIDFKDKKYGNTVLIYATTYKLKKSVKALLENGANPNLFDNYDKESAFVQAIENQSIYSKKKCNQCDSDIIELMIKYRADVNTIVKTNKGYGYSILQLACENGCLNIVEKLVENGADINKSIDGAGNCAILSALIQDNLDIVKYLIIDKKAKVPKVLFKRVTNEDDDKNGEIVTVESLLIEKDYSDNLKNEKLKKEILEYIRPPTKR